MDERKDYPNAIEVCLICKEDASKEKLITVKQLRGAEGINNAAKARKVEINAKVGDLVHSTCRAKFINPKSITAYLNSLEKEQASSLPSSSQKTRASFTSYNSQTDCFFCAKKVEEDSEYYVVRTFSLVENIKKNCQERGDSWALEVKGRLEFLSNDLVAADCIYHQVCSSNFRSKLEIPVRYRSASSSSVLSKSGRPEKDVRVNAFKEVCALLQENYGVSYTLTDLCETMEKNLKDTGEESYDEKWMKIKLIKHFGESIHITEIKGKKCYVILNESVHHILKSHYEKQQGDNEEVEIKRIFETAARLIKSEALNAKLGTKDFYPSIETLDAKKSLEYLPKSLNFFLSSIFSGTKTDLKIAAIGQSILQACLPRTIIAPLQLGLAIQLHTYFRSKFLIDTLFQLGFCSSYKEVMKFERNAAFITNGNLLDSIEEENVPVVLFAADNVDHDLRTLTGKNTFHGMGMIAAITQASREEKKDKFDRKISRENFSDSRIVELAKVNIHRCPDINKSSINMKFTDLPPLILSEIKTDLLWLTAWHFKLDSPNWSGAMKSIHQSDGISKASIIPLPILDLQPSDLSCILSTLLYINKLCKNRNFKPIITFDQPLFWKASLIVNDSRYKDELKEVVLLLGPFHTMMNLLGAAGTLMEGTGLREVLQTVYGENATTHILTGKAVSRALRGHLLVDAGLNSLIFNSIFSDSQNEKNALKEDILNLYEDLIKKKKIIEEMEFCEALSQLLNIQESKKTEFIESSPTSKLWIEYQKLISVIRKFIHADRVGSWKLHLEAMQESLPIFAASGHFNYLKSGYLYLQTMLKLPEQHPQVFSLFQKGHHVVHRTESSWSGLGCDLVIEQVLMRSLKTSGGLTHGSGLTEIQRALWVLSMPICSEYNTAMQSLTNASQGTSEQHKEMHKSRLSQDRNDGAKIFETLEQFSPFSPDSTLRNIVSGVTFDEKKVKVPEFFKAGQKIVDSMTGNTIFDVTFKRSLKVTTLASQESVKFDKNETLKVDPLLLFQRLIVGATHGAVTLEKALQYELCVYPPALFESSWAFRKCQKSQIVHCIVDFCKNISTSDLSFEQEKEAITSEKVSRGRNYVLDGGSLLHRIPWTTGKTYAAIAESYATFTVDNYGKATIVFDGYNMNTPSIKDCTHRKRGMVAKVMPLVKISPQMVFSGSKDKFLSNLANKTQIIHLIGQELESKGCRVIYAESDADVDIAEEGIRCATLKETFVIGEDSDLLLLLLNKAFDCQFELKFKSDTHQKKGESVIHDIKKIRETIGSDLCTRLYFLHAFTGCDSTSHIYGIGKAAAFKVLVKNTEIQRLADIFCSPGKTNAEIENAGKLAILLLYGAKKEDSLETLRLRIFKEKVASTKSFVKPEQLPPTSSAVKYHAFRVYFQIQQWMGVSDLNALSWGWILKDNEYVPKLSDLPPAPPSLLSVIRCKCKKTCDTMRCSCRKMGLPCTDVCGSCQDIGCENNAVILSNDNFSDSDFE